MMFRNVKILFVLLSVLSAILIFLGVFFVLPLFHLPHISFLQSAEVGDEVVVRFGPFISENEARASFHVEPNTDGDLVWLKDYSELHFVPHEGFDPSITYRVTISLQRLPAALVAPARTTFVFVPARAAQDSGVSPPEVSEEKYIDINLETMILTLVDNERPAETFPVGAKGNPWTKPTREGKFRVLSKEQKHWSTIYRLWMPLSLNYSGHYFIHAWPYWPNGQRVNSRYSGGCIRLHDEDAKKVFDWAEIGTTVVVHSTPNRIPLFSAEELKDGDLVREVSDPRVFIVKQVNGKKFKRHVITPKIAEWYPHLSPFWRRVKIVADGTLASHVLSRWVRTSDATNPDDDRLIYEIDAGGIKHLVMCDDKSSGPQRYTAVQCLDSWSTHGWDSDEIYTIIQKELNFYPLGSPVTLKPAF